MNYAYLFTNNKVAYFLGLLTIALIAGYLSIWLSFYYQYHEGLVSWYFPHGVRVAMLFLLPFRVWLAFLCFSIIGSDAYYHLHYPNDEGVSLSTVKLFVMYYGSEALVGAGIYTLYKKQVTNWFTISGVLWIVSLSVLYRFAYLIVPGAFKIGFFSLMPAAHYVEYFVHIQLSGYLVGFYLLSFAYLYKWFTKHKYIVSKNDFKTYLVVVALLIAFNVVLFYVHPVLEYLLRIAVLIPLILIALRFGGLGVLLTSTIITTALLIYLFNAPSDKLLEYQPVIISYLLIGFLVSTVMFENNRSRQAMLNAKKELIGKNNYLTNMTYKLRALSKKVINIQELERKVLSQELHDEIGQNLVALKSSIHLAELETGQSKDFVGIKEHVDMMYMSVYELINWLGPSVLEEYGLYKTLTGNYFRERLSLADIDYFPSINCNAALSQHIEIAIFRICQEAITNVLKHSNATRVDLYLSEQDKTLQLQIKDNGTFDDSLPIEPSGGFGLEGISDRVMTLNGVCIFTRQAGFVIDIKILI